MKTTHSFGNPQRLGWTLAAALTILIVGHAVCSATILSLDFGSGPVQSGFQGFSTTPQTYGAITVSETLADGFFDRGAGGSSALAAVYRDFLYRNDAQTFNVRLDGLAINATYDIRLYSFDIALFPDTDTYTPTIGSGTPGAVSYNPGLPPTAGNEYAASTVVRWTTDATGSLAFNVTSAGFAPRLNGLEIMEQIIPEPSSALLLGLGGLLLWRRSRKA